MGLCVAAFLTGVGVVRLVAAMISPYMPTLTSRILAQLNMPEEAAQLTDDLVKAAAAPQVSRVVTIYPISNSITFWGSVGATCA
jgi:methionyl-tRNA synthetase